MDSEVKGEDVDSEVAEEVIEEEIIKAKDQILGERDTNRTLPGTVVQLTGSFMTQRGNVKLLRLALSKTRSLQKIKPEGQALTKF